MPDTEEVAMRSLGGWVLDQVFELVGIIAEVRRRHLLKTRTDEAHRKALEAERWR